MFANERHEIIMECLHTKQQVNVRELSELLHTSDVTIRKDLNKLERDGCLERTFGGAILPSRLTNYAKSSYVLSEALSDYTQKQTIGRLAADLVSDEDFLFLGPGFTCLEVAKNLKKKQRLSIITMNVSAAIELAEVPEFKLISAPGDFTRRNGTYYVSGPSVSDFFSNMFFDKIFFTIDGFSLQRGFSVLDEITAHIFQCLLKQCKEVIVCATTSKFDKSAMSYLGPAELANTIVSDSPPPLEYEKYLHELGISLVYP